MGDQAIPKYCILSKYTYGQWHRKLLYVLTYRNTCLLYGKLGSNVHLRNETIIHESSIKWQILYYTNEQAQYCLIIEGQIMSISKLAGRRSYFALFSGLSWSTKTMTIDAKVQRSEMSTKLCSSLHWRCSKTSTKPHMPPSIKLPLTVRRSHASSLGDTFLPYACNGFQLTRRLTKTYV